MRFKDVTRMKKSTLKRFLRQEGFGEHLELHRLDCLASTNDLSGYEYCRQLVETLPEEVVRPEPLITGHDLIELGLTPGPTFGQILKEVEDAQLEETLKTREEALSFVRERFLGKEAGTG
jgi:poly(A) polymerase